MPEEYSNYQEYIIEYGSHLDYEAQNQIGKGKYSIVYDGVVKSTNEKIVIKYLKPIKIDKVKREISIMNALKGHPNIIQLIDVIQNQTSGENKPALVIEYVDTQKLSYRALYQKFSDFDTRLYMYEVLKALDFTHSKGIMHRDIKPLNIMMNFETKQVKLIDWGLAEYYHIDQEYNLKVASRHYKGPELLVGMQYYDYSLDIWSLGCVFAGILFFRFPIFYGDDNTEQLQKIVAVLGTEDLFKFLDDYDLELDEEQSFLLTIKTKRMDWKYLAKAFKAHFEDDEAFDLLDLMLRYDPIERVTTKDALEHPYFQPVRDYYQQKAI